MRSHEEVVERLKEKHEEYLADKRKKTARILGIAAMIVLVGVSVLIYRKIGKDPKPQSEPINPTVTPTGVAEPTNGITPPDSISPTGEVTPAGKDKQIVMEEDRRKSLGSGSARQMSDDSGEKKDPPRPGVVYIDRTLGELLQDNAGSDNILFSVGISVVLPQDDAELKAFESEYKKYFESSVYLQYRQELKQWVEEVYVPLAHKTAEENGEDWNDCLPNEEDMFQPIWRESHTEEEWGELSEALEHIKTYVEEYTKLQDRIREEELRRIRTSDFTMCYREEYDSCIYALITVKQFESFEVSERFVYRIHWRCDKDLENMEKLSGFTKAPAKTPAKPEQVIVIDASDPKIQAILQGEHDANEMVTISVYFGNAREEALRLLQEEYPEEYADYMSRWQEVESLDKNDPENALALRGWELIQTLPGVWEQEQEDRYFERHPEQLQYKTEYQTAVSLRMKVPYAMVPQIAQDENVTMVVRYPEDKRKPTIIGEYNGSSVYDFQGVNEFTEDWYYDIDGESAPMLDE